MQLTPHEKIRTIVYCNIVKDNFWQLVIHGIQVIFENFIIKTEAHLVFLNASFETIAELDVNLDFCLHWIKMAWKKIP